MGFIFPMVISSEFSMGQYREDVHREDAPHFKARVTDRIFELIFKFVCFFFLEKSYHSNLAITFYVDHQWPNGFQHQIGQARNCPIRLPDARWRHIRLRNGLLHNHKNFRISASFSEKGMNLKMPKMPRNSSLVSILWNRQPFLNKLIPQLILEKFFRKNFGFFHNFFAYFSP